MVQRSICKVPHSFPNPCARSLARQGDREHATEVKARAPSAATLQQSTLRSGAIKPNGLLSTSSLHPTTPNMAPTTPFALSLLERAFSPETAQSHHANRVSKPLPVRATSPTPSARAVRRKALNSRAHDRKKQRAQKPRPLSAAQKRALGLGEIPAAQRKYALYEPLHALWAAYMREVLGLEGEEKVAGRGYVTAASGGAMLASADLHGARLSVVRSRCVSRVGLEGIVVRDTRYTFEIVTRGDVVKCKLWVLVW
jgi:ribonuclease P protein subunit POP4